MRVLMVNSFHYERGGSERYVFDLSALLAREGHDVVPFAMAHARNRPTPWARYFVPFVDFAGLQGRAGGVLARGRAFARVLWYGRARRSAARLVEDARPDVAHVHGIGHELSPSVLDAFRRDGLPVVQTLHDYGLLCPATHFLSNGEVCEACRGGRYWRAALRRCKKGSLPASALAALERTVHGALRVYERSVGVFIAPSRFLQAKLLEHGFAGRVVHLPNFVDVDAIRPGGEASPFVLYAGRLARIKGLRTLFDAVREAGPVNLVVAGEGELEPELRRRAAAEGLAGVSFAGHLDKPTLLRLMRRAAFTVVPSECYENCPMVILESFASGRPVLASRLGALPDLVRHGESGLLFEPGNAADLAEKIRFLLDRPGTAADLGRGARRQAETEHRPLDHYRRLMEIYQEAGA